MERLVPLLPANARQGHRWSSHRTVINGVMFRSRAGCPWRDLPGEYGVDGQRLLDGGAPTSMRPLRRVGRTEDIYKGETGAARSRVPFADVAPALTRFGWGDDAIYWAARRGRYVGAASLG